MGQMMPLYFAFGANMDVGAMAIRCPRSSVLGIGHLEDHRFFISADGYASVRPERGARVYGLVWRLDPADVPVLDAYEEVDDGLYSKHTRMVSTPAGAHDVFLYVGRHRGNGYPHPGYMESVCAAAQAALLPTPYVDELRGWLTPATPKP